MSDCVGVLMLVVMNVVHHGLLEMVFHGVFGHIVCNNLNNFGMLLLCLMI